MSFSVDRVPGLPDGFAETFISRVIPVGDDALRLHAVIGGSGPPLLLLPAWPQFWYHWRHVMPDLAHHFTIVAADLRGLGGSAKPASGYDAGTLADDMAALMTELGHEQFAVAGYDLGMIVGYALAAHHRERVTQLAVGEAVVPGFSAPPPLLVDPMATEALWHFVFNSLASINEKMVAGREEIYFGHQFTSKSARTSAFSQETIDLYVDVVRDPAALHAAFEFYRRLDQTSEQVRQARADGGALNIPVLAIGGEYSTGSAPAEDMRKVADNVKGLVIPGCGHFLAEEAPKELLDALLDFFQK